MLASNGVTCSTDRMPTNTKKPFWRFQLRATCTEGHTHAYTHMLSEGGLGGVVLWKKNWKSLSVVHTCPTVFFLCLAMSLRVSSSGVMMGRNSRNRIDLGPLGSLHGEVIVGTSDRRRGGMGWDDEGLNEFGCRLGLKWQTAWNQMQCK